MNNWQNEITAERKRLFIDNIANHTRLSVLAIEKDWWVERVKQNSEAAEKLHKQKENIKNAN